MHDSIIGVWSVNAFHDSDGPGEDVLTFRDDNTGRYDFGNYGSYASTTFRWSFPKFDHLTIIGVHFFRFSALDPIHDMEVSPKSFEEVAYQIDVEASRVGRRIPVFRADLWLSTGFGLETRDISTFYIEKRLVELAAPR